MAGATEREEDRLERRAFPRIPASCPVLYLVKPKTRWIVAKLEEFSATGMSMVCDENLPMGSGICIQIKPGSLKTVPQISAEGIVIRCDTNSENRFKISCKITKVLR